MPEDEKKEKVENYIIVDQGRGRIEIAINDIEFVTLKYGMFGRTLGYTNFLLTLKIAPQHGVVDDLQSILPLAYVPQTKLKELELHITKYSNKYWQVLFCNHKRIILFKKAP